MADRRHLQVDLHRPFGVVVAVLVVPCVAVVAVAGVVLPVVAGAWPAVAVSAVPCAVVAGVPVVAAAAVPHVVVVAWPAVGYVVAAHWQVCWALHPCLWGVLQHDVLLPDWPVQPLCLVWQDVH